MDVGSGWLNGRLLGADGWGSTIDLRCLQEENHHRVVERGSIALGPPALSLSGATEVVKRGDVLFARAFSSDGCLEDPRETFLQLHYGIRAIIC